MGLNGFEPLTSPLSGVRSNQLSYRPAPLPSCFKVRWRQPTHTKRGETLVSPRSKWESDVSSYRLLSDDDRHVFSKTEGANP